MMLLPAPQRTIGQVLPTLASPVWQRQQLAHRLREEFWRGFWWAAWLGLLLGAWGGWLAAQARLAGGP